MTFATEPGLHPLAPVTGGSLHGTYLRDEDGSVCIVNMWAPEEGKGALSAFLDNLPDVRVTFDNVVSPILEGALLRRGYGVVDDAQNLWGRVVTG